MQCITVERCPDSWLFSLSGWPQGIDAFDGLQFLQLNCGEVHDEFKGCDFDYDALDLAHVAYIPHVSLWCKGATILKISKGSWKVLEVYGAGIGEFGLGDAKAFVEGTNTFSFTFNSLLRHRPQEEASKFSEELKKAGAEIGERLYEYYDTYEHGNMDSPLDGANFNSVVTAGAGPVSFGKAPWVELRNCQREGSAIDSVFWKARLKYLGGA